MKNLKKIFLEVMLFPVLSVYASDGVVCVDRVNIRIQPDLESKVVCVLSRGQTVRTAAAAGGWSRIAIPENGEVWVHRSFLTKSGVLKDKAVFRCGPGTVHAPFEGKVKGGCAVKVLERSKSDSWLKISPPEGLFCYVMTTFVTSKSADPVPEVARTAYISGIAKRSVAEGCLERLPKKVFDAQYCLYFYIDDKKYPVCYVTNSNLNLSLWEGRQVRLEGMRRWVWGNDFPFLQADSISPAW